MTFPTRLAPWAKLFRSSGRYGDSFHRLGNTEVGDLVIRGVVRNALPDQVRGYAA